MIIGIDASKLAEEKRTGIDNTIRELVLELQKIDHKNSYYLYTPKPLDKIYLKKNFTEKLIPFIKFWHKFRLPLALLRDRPDLFLELTSSIPPLSNKKNMVLIHDLAFKYFPEAYGQCELALQENALKVAVKKADCILLTLEANKNDFLKYFPESKSKIRILPLAYDRSVYKRVAETKKILPFDDPYFLSVGRIEKRKNTAKLIEAFDLFKKNDKDNYKLVLVGKNGYGSEDAMKAYENSIHKADIHFAGYINDNDLASLYAKATAFIFPSLYEGYGIPILEAFGCGTPVATSDVPIMKEVGADAAIYFDPRSIKSISEVLANLSSSPSLRNKLIARGLERAKNFSWRKSAETLLGLIEQLS